ncbi:MAG: hypothetical protein GX605_02320 [Chloroflexi bacterium]|nr:hypothetical protein [Chloroflexota bacterium]
MSDIAYAAEVIAKTRHSQRNLEIARTVEEGRRSIASQESLLERIAAAVRQEVTALSCRFVRPSAPSCAV